MPQSTKSMGHEQQSVQEVKSDKEFKKAYRFLRNDRLLLKNYEWWNNNPESLLSTCIENLLAKRDKHGNTLLHRAAEKNDIKAARRLIRLGLAFDIENISIKTPLNIAIKSKKQRVKKLFEVNADLLYLPHSPYKDLNQLLQARACVNIRDHYNYTPLLRITWSDFNDSRIDRVKTLIDNNGAVNAQTEGGATALHHATYFGNTKITQLLLDSKASINIQDQWSRDTPLHNSLGGSYNKQQREALVALLLNAHADVCIKNSRCQTALDKAREQKCRAIITLLEQAELKQTQQL